MVIVCDRRPEMGLFPAELPWLHKPEATAWCVRLLAASAVNQRALVGYLDHASHESEGVAAGQPFWRPPRGQASGWHRDLVETLAGHVDGPRDAPEDAVEQALRFLGLLRGVVTVGSFVFVLSDFLIEISDDAWGGILGRGWDVVPVVIQDPVWEHTFPPMGGVATTFSDVGGDRLLPTRLTAGEVERLRRRNEERRASISRRSRRPVSTTSTSLPGIPCRSTPPSSAGRMRGSCTAGGSGDRAAPLAQRALGGGRRPRRSRGRRRRAAPRPGLVGRRRRLVCAGRDRRRNAPRATERPLRRPGRRDRQDRRRRACGRPGVGEPRPVVQAVPGVRHDAPRAGGNRPRRRGPVPLSAPVRHGSVHPRDGARAPRWEHTDGPDRAPAGDRPRAYARRVGGRDPRDLAHRRDPLPVDGRGHREREPVAPRFVATAPGYAVDPGVLGVAARRRRRRGDPRRRRPDRGCGRVPPPRAPAAAPGPSRPGRPLAGARAPRARDGRRRRGSKSARAPVRRARGERAERSRRPGRRLAWSPPGPSEPELDDLSRLVRSGANGR